MKNLLRKIVNRYNNSIQTKLMLAFLLTTVLILFMNIFMYINTNKMLASLDEVYAENISLNEITDTLDKINESLTGYLNTRSSAYMEDYYRYVQDYSNLVDNLYGGISSNKLLLTERDIKNMSDNYVQLTNYALDGKRGGNIEKYKVRYQESGVLYNYLKSIGEAEGEFDDTQFADDYLISDWAKAGVAFASEKGYVNGKGNNTFDPKGRATRAELAQIFYNIFK